MRIQIGPLDFFYGPEMFTQMIRVILGYPIGLIITQTLWPLVTALSHFRLTVGWTWTMDFEIGTHAFHPDSRLSSSL